MYDPVEYVQPLEKWDERFVELAATTAGWSKDPRCKIGAVLVSQCRRQIFHGYNGLPRSIPDSAMILNDKDMKNLYTVHAELNAILNAKTDLTAFVMYVTRAPCHECCKAIIQAGIFRVVRPVIKEDPDSDWLQTCRDGQHMLAMAGVRTTRFNPQTYDLKERFPGVF